MAIHRGPRLALVIWCFLFCVLYVHSASESVNGENGVVEPFGVGGRLLLQNIVDCPHDWNQDNFTVLQENCPYVVNDIDVYDRKRCCENGLGAMLCPYADLVNDLATNCAKMFFGVLRAVDANYTSEWFAIICTDPNSPLGVECPANLTGNNSASPLGNASPSSQSIGSALLVAVAIFEILVLLF